MYHLLSRGQIDRQRDRVCGREREREPDEFLVIGNHKRFLRNDGK